MTIDAARKTEHSLSGNLVPVFSDRSVEMVLTRIRSTQFTPRVKPDIETGVLHLEVLRVFHGDGLKRGDLISVPFDRYVESGFRKGGRVNEWEELALRQGDFLLLAVKPNDSASYVAIAGKQVKSAADPQLEAVRRIYEIQNEQRPTERYRLLGEALTDQHDLLRSYALDAISRKGLVPWSVGARIIEDAIDSSLLSGEEKRELGYELSEHWDNAEIHSADPVDIGIIATLARQMVNSMDHRTAQEWMMFLLNALSQEFSADPKKDRQIRLALIRGVTNPAHEKVILFLDQELKRAEDKGEIELPKELADLWRAAWNEQP